MEPSEPPSAFRPNPEFRGRIVNLKKREPGEAGDWRMAYLLTGLPTTFPPIKHAGGQVWIRIATWTKIGRWAGGEVQEACLEDLRPSCSVEINLPSVFEGGVAELARHFSGPSWGQRLRPRIRRIVGALLKGLPMSDRETAGQLPPVTVYPEWVLLHEDCSGEPA